MKLQRLYSLVRQAMEAYDMIEEGDRVAIGVSGGKDSLTLLYALAGLRRFYPRTFELMAITVNLGYEEMNFGPVADLCRQLEVPYYMVDTKIQEMLPTENPCSLCARLRRGALNDKALELGCNKIAYAHHMDDVVGTFLLSLIYEGRISTFWPVTCLGDSGLTVIRPLIFVRENEVKGFRNKYDLPVVKNSCPYDKHTEREYVNELIRSIDRHAPGVRERMMTAIRQGNLEGWEKKTKSEGKS